MKRAIAIFFGVLLIFALGACGAPNEAGGEDNSDTMSVCYPNDNADGFLWKDVDGTDGLVPILAELGAIPEGSELVAFSADDEGGAVLDMNDAFLAGITTTGSAGEYMMMGSLVNTYLKNYDLETITVTANGAVIETGHMIYDAPMSVFE